MTPMGLALADAFDLGRVRGIDLRAALALLLLAPFRASDSGFTMVVESQPVKLR